jgi:hypothetical protein
MASAFVDLRLSDDPDEEAELAAVAASIFGDHPLRIFIIGFKTGAGRPPQSHDDWRA